MTKRILVGITLGVLLGLLIAPQTRWLVSLQARDLLRLGPMPGYSEVTGYGKMASWMQQAWSGQEQQIETVAARHPNDYLLQYAAANSGGTLWDAADVADQLRRLESRFPNSPSLRANILRHACGDGISWVRPEEFLLRQQPVPAYIRLIKPNNPAVLAAYDADAAAGEYLDPGNAYFPMMRAVGLYAGHHDAEARVYILQAGACPRWQDYYPDEVDAEVKMQRLAFGDTSAVWHAMTAGAVSFANYSAMLFAASTATYQAMQDEQQGRVQEGITLREAIIRYGDLMRAQSNSVSGSLIGVYISQTAMLRPGGAAWIPVSRQGIAQTLVVNRYTRYLRAHGQPPSAAKWVETVYQSGVPTQRVIEIERTADWTTSPVSPFGLPLHKLLLFWIVDLLLLANIIWLAAFAGFALILQCYPPPNATLDLKLLFLTLMLVLLGIVSLFGKQMMVCVHELLNVYSAFANPLIPPKMAFSLFPESDYVLPIVLPLVVMLVSLALIWRRPMRQTIAAAFVPIVCVALLLYAGLMLRTARQERAENTALNHMLQGEGRYLAEQTGQTWPGVAE